MTVELELDYNILLVKVLLSKTQTIHEIVNKISLINY